MLTVEEDRINLRAIEVITALNRLPLMINTKTGEFSRKSNIWNKILFMLIFSLSALYVGFLGVRLVQVTADPELFRWKNAVLHFIILIIYTMCMLQAYVFCIRWTSEFALVGSTIYLEKSDEVKVENGIGSTGSGSGSQQSASPRIRMSEYSLYDLFTKYHFYTIALSLVLFLSFTYSDPSRPQIFYSMLPAKFQTPGWLVISYVFEFWINQFIASFGYVSNTIQLLFLGKAKSELNRLRNRAKSVGNHKLDDPEPEPDRHTVAKNIRILKRAARETKELYLFIVLFNQPFAHLVLAQRLVCMALSIAGSFFSIRYKEKHPLLVLFTGYTSVTSSFIHFFMYQKAFVIPGEMKELKSELLLAFRRISSRNSDSDKEKEWKIFKREISSIRNLGIRVGSFKMMERNSNLMFINFVIEQVVNLLCLIPH